MMLLDGQKTWIDLLNSIHESSRLRYHRLNISFLAAEPELDDVERMPELKHQVQSYIAARTIDLNRCADNILASLFYIELDNHPIFYRFNFVCKAKILCRLEAGSMALRTLIIRLREQEAKFYLNSQDHISCTDQDIHVRSVEGQAFFIPVTFNLMSMEECIDIKVGGLTQRARSISNCPYKLSELVTDQGLQLAFGRSDHKRQNEFPDYNSKRPRYR